MMDEKKIGEGKVDAKDYSIFMCLSCGMRWATDDIPYWGRGVEQEIEYKLISICQECSSLGEGLKARADLKRRVDLPTSIGSIIGGM